MASVAGLLRRDIVGGALLLTAAAVAVVWANTPASPVYQQLRDTVVGPSAVHLDLTLGQWAADGLLAIFFFIAGLELKREFVAGELRDPRRAMLPVFAAVGGMLIPAAAYVGVNVWAGSDALAGWAIPTATDIAFALAVLAVVGSSLPLAVRTFLLTLAIVDDLLAITVIALFYTGDLHLGWLALALLPLAVFGLLVQRRIRSAWLLLPLAAATWTLVHASGVHATIAGVLLALTVPVAAATSGRGAGVPLAEHLEHRWRPLSAGFAVPVFAFFAAGVAVGGVAGLGTALTDPVAIGIVTGLLLGKAVGILGATFLAVRLTRARLDPRIRWSDLTGLAMLAGIGFTVSLLISDLAYGAGSSHDDHAKVGILAGSLPAATVGGLVLGRRNRQLRTTTRSRDGSAAGADPGRDGDDGQRDAAAQFADDELGGARTEREVVIPAR